MAKAEKPICSIPRCTSKNKTVHALGWCKNHHNSYLKYGDPEKAKRNAPKGSRGPQPITVKNLKELGLYTAFDVSRWCLKHGVQSVYLEYRGRESMQVDHYYMTEGRWLVMDAATPGKILQKFTSDGSPDKASIFQRAAAWVDAHYGVDIKKIPAVDGAFPAPAVDLILSEIEIIRKVWSPDPQIIAEIPQDTYSRVVEEYRVPKKVQDKRKVSV